ncbi:MAG: class I SAM-dependent methyltransferase [Gemmatimonadota bacterium]
MSEPIDAELKSHYDRAAEGYEAARYRSPSGSLLHELERRLVQDWAKGGAGSRGLDAPCGTGRLTEALARRCSLVVGCDISAPMLEKARAGERATGIALARANNRRLPFVDGSFDTVLCINFLQLVPREQWPLLLAELHRLVKPGGTLLLECKTPKKLAPLWRLLRRPDPPGRGPVPLIVFRPGDGPALFRGFRKGRRIGLLFPVLPRLGAVLGRRGVLALHLMLGRLPVVRMLATSILFELRRKA